MESTVYSAQFQGATVLLVEDDNGIRKLLRYALNQRNFKVIEAGSGNAAIELSRAFDGNIELLLTDINMPGMDGIVLSETLLEERSGIRVIQMSGGRMQGAISSGAPVPFLQKPFEINALLRKIDEVLSAPSRSLAA
jgi:DNA-binding NtrC family response regulator